MVDKHSSLEAAEKEGEKGRTREVIDVRDGVGLEHTVQCEEERGI